MGIILGLSIGELWEREVGSGQKELVFEKTVGLLIFKSIIKKEMKTAILSGESEADLKLIIRLAHQLGIKAKVLTEEDAEDLAMVYAME